MNQLFGRSSESLLSRTDLDLRIVTVLIFAILFVLGGCAHSPAVQHLPKQDDPTQPKQLVVFIDGTRNDEGSHTNISKLHKLVTLQPNTNVQAVYIEGVGNGYKIGGMALGWGIGRDVREAYLFLAENYRSPRDKITLFGFSRGAYAARVLAGLIHVAGIPDLSQYPMDEKSASLKGEKLKNYQRSKRQNLINKIYAAYKGKDLKIAKRRDLVAEVFDRAIQSDKFSISKPDDVEIQFMGLWDTVEALAFPDYAENIEKPSKQYVDQLCNITRAAHAVSIDDDRARVFTPILLTLDHLKKCLPGDYNNDKEKTMDIAEIVEEVWFSGSHSDVGGGYLDTDISGVSLNWMIGQIQDVEKSLLPVGTKVYQDPLGKTHDPEKAMGIFYQKRQRDLPCYAQKIYAQKMDVPPSADKQVKLKIHPSVFKRLSAIPVQHFEFKWMGGDQKDENRGTYKNCWKKPVKEKDDFGKCFEEKAVLINRQAVIVLVPKKGSSCFFDKTPSVKP